jgi:thiamine pyrophosphokinase
MSVTVIVASAPWRWRVPFVELVRGADSVLAADGGANHLARIGVRPDAVVGDLDSILARVRRWVGEERMVLRPDQEFTDLHKTLAYAFDEHDATHVTVLAGTGGRIDHTMENLALLARWAVRGRLELRDEHHRIMPVIESLEVETRAGQEVSLMPVGRCERVWTRGLRWALAGEPLDLSGRTGISNVAESERTEIRVDGGVVLVFLSEPIPNW